MKFTGNKDTDYLILERLADRDLLSTCSTNRYLRQLCENEQFWRKRYLSKFNLEKGVELPNQSWKKNYLEAISDPKTYNKNIFSKNSDIDDFLKTIYPTLPRYVNKTIFYEDMKKDILDSIATNDYLPDSYIDDEEEEEMRRGFDLIEVVGIPLTLPFLNIDVDTLPYREGYSFDDMTLDVKEKVFKSFV